MDLKRSRFVAVTTFCILVVLADMSHAQGSGNSATIDVSANSEPWNIRANPSMVYGVEDGTQASFLSSEHGFDFSQGSEFAVEVISGTSSAGPGWPNVDFRGDPEVPTDGAEGSTGTGFPAKYSSSPGEGRLMGLIGAFVDNSGVVVGSPFLILENRASVVAPNGATRLQFGINDDLFQDNSGGYRITVSQASE